ncbi:MAG: flagellar motor switch protein FliN [Actinomycetota bacterium]|jgi:flagellar motor switch protein FliN/FliY|nr:flagellar motor switch protein FliN [Actinomycetota bacterium]
MTILAQHLDLDALQAAAGVLTFQFGALGDVETRSLGPQERSGQLLGGVALSVRTDGTSPGLFGLVAGADAAATVLGSGDVLERWEPVMAAIVIALSAEAGDLAPQNIQVLAPGAGGGPALDPAAISVGFFLEGQLIAAVGFLADPEPEPAVAAQLFQPLASADIDTLQVRRMHLLHDVEMGVSVELGRTRMTIRELLSLSPGAIVQLNKAAGAPVDLLVNGTLMAQGEVVVVDEEFAIRISEIVTPELTDRRGGSERRGA